jgi:hypothetical protein
MPSTKRSLHVPAEGVATVATNLEPRRNSPLGRRVLPFFLFLLLLGMNAVGQTSSFDPNPSAGPGTIIVQSKFGGQIFGFDIDQNGTEGVLTEAKDLSNGKVQAAIETFDQTTGKILNVVQETRDQDDFVTMGVVGASVGLIDHEHEVSFLHLNRIYETINPLSSNKVTGHWKPPVGTTHIIPYTGVSRSQGVPDVAVFATDESGNFISWVFESNVAANTFGPIVKLTDSLNFGSVPPPMAFDSSTNQAILGGGDGCFGCKPVIGLADLINATFSEFTGSGFGFVNGIAVDSADGIFCTDTEDDATVEFYNLSTQKAFAEVIFPGSGGQQFYSGADIEFDPVNKLFLVAQPNSSSSSSGSSIYVYDTQGNLQETLSGFSFSNTFNVIPMHIAIKPSTRSGFVDGPDSGVTEIQSFTY